MSNLEWIEELQHQNSDLSKTIERLREQLNEANEVIKKYVNLGNWYDFYNEGPCRVADDMENYLNKWNVK